MKSVKMNFAWELPGDRHFSLPATNMILMWNIVVLLPGAAKRPLARETRSILPETSSSIIVWLMQRFTLTAMRALWFVIMQIYISERGEKQDNISNVLFPEIRDVVREIFISFDEGML